MAIRTATPTSTAARRAQVLLTTTAKMAVTNGRAAVSARLGRRAGPPAGVGLTDYDPLAPEVIADPYPAYRGLLAGPPVAYSRARDLYVISHYDAVRDAARADAVLSSAQGITRFRITLPMLITMDRPDHTRLRRVVLPDFTRPALQQWDQTIDRLAAELVDGLRRGGGAEAVAGLAIPLPVRVIAHLLGIPDRDQAKFRTWSDGVVEGFELELGPGLPLRFTRSARALFNLRSYLHQQIVSGELRRGGGILAGLQERSMSGEITGEDLFWFTVLLLVAGNETTTNLISTMLLTLARRPEQYAVLRERPELVPGAIEEQLRYSSPIQGFYRTALADHAVGDAVIPAGARVLLLFGAANRDPRQFPDPDTYDVARPVTGHLAFGSGIHLCLGAHLARAEGQAVLRHLLDTTERIEVTGTPVWRTGSALRGLARLPVELH